MTKYIDADRLRAELTDRVELFKELSSETINPIRIDECSKIIDIIDSLQQDETQVDKMLCSQAWWEEQGWIMIPPDATIEGIDALLRQVRKKLQQEQPGVDLEKETKRWWKEHLHLNPENKLWMDAHQSVVFARHFYELGQKEMRKRLSNPEYNKAVIERMKSEYPATKEEN